MITKEKDTHFIVGGIHYATGQPVKIEIRDGRIVSVKETDGTGKDFMDLFIAPGLIDNQINGYANIDFSGNDLSAEGVIEAANAIWRDGVTTFLPTLITNSHENLIRNFQNSS